MSNPLLAKALEELHELQKNGSIFQSSQFSGNNMTYLKKAGYLKPIIRGWYCQSHPGERDGDTTTWYAGFWEFVAKYLHSRFGTAYCLSPEISLVIHTRNSIIPKQIVAVVQKGSVNKVDLLHGTSIFIYPEKNNFPQEIQTLDNLNILPLEHALCKAGPQFFKNYQEEAEIAIGMIKDVSGLLSVLLTQSRMDAAASRLCGAFHFLGRDEEAHRIKTAYEAATFKHISLESPFEKTTPSLQPSRERNPYALRLQSMWNRYRDVVAELTTNITTPGQKLTSSDIVKNMDAQYANDAYHSLSIEGYKVTRELIQKIAQGGWNPEENQGDEATRNALAAKGYHLAYEALKRTIINAVDQHRDMAALIRTDHHKWYSELFAPSVQAGILAAHHLAGYRNAQVYLRGSSHVPFPKEAIVDAMEVYFELLENEKNSIVRAVLGHHLFGYIHPYMDGNGRMARFIMNAFLVSTNLPWVIIEVDDRDKYMRTLEEASVHGDIKPFAEFIVERIGKKH